MFPAGLQFVPYRDQRIYGLPHYQDKLAAAGLADFDQVMQFPGGQLYKRNRLRSVVRLDDIGPPALFLKRHFTPLWRTNFRAWSGMRKPLTAARLELEGIMALKGVGIASMQPVAIGQARPDSWCEVPSFLITEEITAQRVEDFIPQRFGAPPASCRARRNLTRTLAELAARMHNAGLHHRDFYLGHILIKEVAGSFQLWVIDVQRVRQCRHLAQRWRVKDLSQLLYTAPDLVTATDKLRFFLHYQSHDTLTRADRRFIRRILRKTGRTARHVIKKRARRARKATR